jgi:hypothetical protein
MQRVVPGNTNDATTLKPVAEDLEQRFGLREPILVPEFRSWNLDVYLR